MKWMIASDLHGDAACTQALLQQYEASGAKRLLLLGDLLYHGPRNRLPSCYDPVNVIQLLNGVREQLVCVRGNCDTEVDQMVLTFPILSDIACIFAGEHTFFATHGHRFSPVTPPPLRPGDILLCGHSHVPAFEYFNTNDGQSHLYINPGSVSLPKQNSPRGYVLVEENLVQFHTLDGEIYRKEIIK